MPVSVTNSQLIYDSLKACDIRLMSALPETWLVHLIRMADDDPDVRWCAWPRRRRASASRPARTWPA